MKSLAIIIPAYNEEKKIATDIQHAFAFLKENKIPGEVIVSTDGIKDRTNHIVKDLMKKYKNLQLISVKKKIGKGAAIKRGVLAAQSERILFADAGFCVPYDNALKGLKLLDDGYDCAIGSRALRESKILKKQPLYRKIGSTVFGFIVRGVLGIPHYIRDTQCGFKLYTYETAEEVYGELQSKGMMFDIEVILRLKKLGKKMKCFPVSWKNDDDTKFNPVTGSVENLVEILRMKIKHGL